MTVIALKFNAEMYRNTLQFYGVALPFIILNVINLLKYFSSRVYGENYLYLMLQLFLHQYGYAQLY